MRIASLLPSATEVVTLVAAHCEDAQKAPELVGRSHECDWPPGLAHLPVLTAAKTVFTSSADVDKQVREALASGNGLYTVDKELLQQLKPDVIVTQSLCSVCSVDLCQVQDIASCIELRPLVIDLNPQSLGDVLADVQRVGELLGQPAAGAAAAAALQRRVDAALAAVPKPAAAAAGEAPAAAAAGEAPAAGGGAEAANGAAAAGATPAGGSTPAGGTAFSGPSVAFLEWVAPIFVGGHWTPQLIEMAGGRHPLNPTKSPSGGAGRSFTVTPEQLADSCPDWIVVAPCGLDLPTVRKEMEASLAGEPWWRDLAAVQEGRVVLVDGNQMFNRPGPRLVDALEFLVGLLQGRPDLCPAGFPWERA